MGGLRGAGIGKSTLSRASDSEGLSFSLCIDSGGVGGSSGECDGFRDIESPLAACESVDVDVILEIALREASCYLEDETIEKVVDNIGI